MQIESKSSAPLRDLPSWAVGLIPTEVAARFRPEQFQLLYNLGIGFLNGTVRDADINDLSREMADALASVIRGLLERRTSGRMLDIQQANPYFSPNGSAVVTDG